MRRLAFLLWALLAASGVQAACEPGGMGGTGIGADGGIGGTGIEAQGDVGLIGIISGFGSICVNGIEVRYDATTPVMSAGASSSPAALALGQLVAVRATADGARIRARDIRILDAIVGRVSAFDPARRQLQVAGQDVRLTASTVLAVNAPPAELIGRNVAVSGLWRADATLAATRVAAAPADAPTRVGAREWPDLGTRRLIVEGYVADVRADAFRIGGMVFRARPGVFAQVAPDRLVRLSARTERDGSRIAERVEVLDLARDRNEKTRPAGERGDGGEGNRSAEPAGRPERSENRGPGRLEQPERIERPERAERPERPERIERPERSGRD